MLQTNTQTPVSSLPDFHGIIVSMSEYRGMRFFQVFHVNGNPLACGKQTGRIV